ncbi:hypothetical protein P280DRAFT_223367 [Massarina eburnea CBS 473.64]|uniref:Uncharacterized protein n=1 Tax=Massarina eburnea CBS 473.64 TaxID=1395130 RepID=A0A6A6SCC0_9PLEO|nr:hypothetical protein P280DRAFT_223367 [Massarina eburnea CBS 473.64]
MLMVRNLLLAASVVLVEAQDNLGVAQGYTTFKTSAFNGQVVKQSQTLASLRSASSNFDFLPLDLISQLAANGVHHTGDITIRYRTSGTTAWTSIDSSTSRKAVTPLTTLGTNVVAGADIAATLGSNLPFKVTREWIAQGKDLALRFNITNTATSSIELGSLGLPIIINNIFTNRLATDTQDKCSLADPYIGLQAGFVRVSPLKGTGNALAVAPLGSTRFEAWRFLTEQSGNFGYQGQTFEGNYEWQIHSLAWAENEWKSATPWNTATSKSLKAGEVYSVGVRFLLADSVQGIEDVVSASGTPLAVGIPGYVVPADLTARLYLNYTAAVTSIDTGGAFTVTAPTSSGQAYKLVPTGQVWGRARVTIVYADGKEQTIHYFLPKATPSTLADLGKFFTTSAHFTNTSDPFNRAPSIMTYDRELNRIVDQDPRVWIAGLSDEGGTGAYLATAMKQFIQPKANEVSILDAFIHDTLVGTLQQNNTFGIVASAFFYDPTTLPTYPYDKSTDWTSWTSWTRDRAYTTRRAYNYIHPVATYWAMYRVARNYPSTSTNLRAEWPWYLSRAYNTTQYCLSNRAANCDYGLVGLMGETVLGSLLTDLQHENMSSEAAALETTMRYRATLWSTQAVPYGSEMAWDSTGQEGVYYWSDYFGFSATVAKTVGSVLGYMTTVPHWGWNGNARRYWDFVYGGKLRQVERQIHHYGSGLNSLPLLAWVEGNGGGGGGGAGEEEEELLYALRVGFAGNMAPLTNVDQEGFAAAAFHSFPELLRWDAYSGDYGPGFLGLALGQCVYIVSSSRYGDVVFGGNLVEESSNTTTVVVEPRDAVRRRVFVAELGLKVEISAGVLERVVFGRGSGSLELVVGAASTEDGLKATEVVVWVKEVGKVGTRFGVVDAVEGRGGWVVGLEGETTGVKIVES